MTGRRGRTLDDLHEFARAYRGNATSASPMADTVAELGIDRATGKRWAADCRQNGMLEPVETPSALPEQWREALERFTSYLEFSARSNATTQGYLMHLRWLANDSPAGPFQLDTLALLDWLDSHRWSRETRKKVLVSLRCFYSWATAEGLIEWAPTAGVPSAEQRSGPSRLAVPHMWAGPIRDYLTWCQAANYSKGTLDMKRWWLTRLSEVAADPWGVTTSQLASFLSQPDTGPAHKRAGRSCLRSFYGWAVTTGHMARSPAADLPVVRTPRALPRPASAQAVREALQVDDDRVRLAVMLGAYAGLRISEISSLHVSNVTDDALVITGKGGHQRQVPLHPELAAEIRNYRLRHALESGWIFPSTYRLDDHLTGAHLGKLVTKALPGHYTTHTLRHRFATAAYVSQRDLRAVQELLGHMKPETTARYAAVPEGALRSAVNGVGL